MPDQEPFDPLAGLRAMADVQRAGLEAAAAVVERMLELGRLGTRGPFPFPLPPVPADGNDGDRPRSPRDSQGEVRRLRGDAERLLELWGEWMRLLLDAAADAAEAGVAGRNGVPPRLVLGPTPSGEPVVGRAWLHVLEGPPAAPARLTATRLTAHDGDTIEPDAFAFDPPLLDTFAPRSSQEIVVTVEVPAETVPGRYHGHILAAGLPEVCLPVTVEVAE